MKNLKPISFKNKNLLSASIHAYDGIKVLAKESAARREAVVIGISVIALALHPCNSSLFLLIASLLLLATEALNTAIEVVCDLYTNEYNLKIKHAKDLGAAAVFIICLAWAAALIYFIGLDYLPRLSS